jgi:hypothetical protein
MLKRVVEAIKAGDRRLLVVARHTHQKRAIFDQLGDMLSELGIQPSGVQLNHFMQIGPTRVNFTTAEEAGVAWRGSCFNRDFWDSHALEAPVPGGGQKSYRLEQQT